MRSIAELCKCADIAALRTALQEMCAPFGTVRRMDILTAVHEGRQQAICFLRMATPEQEQALMRLLGICFLRMATPEQEQALMRLLGVGRFGGEIVFVVDLDAPPPSEDSGPSSAWADSEVL